MVTVSTSVEPQASPLHVRRLNLVPLPQVTEQSEKSVQSDQLGQAY